MKLIGGRTWTVIDELRKLVLHIVYAEKKD